MRDGFLLLTKDWFQEQRADPNGPGFGTAYEVNKVFAFVLSQASLSSEARTELLCALSLWCSVDLTSSELSTGFLITEGGSGVSITPVSARVSVTRTESTPFSDGTFGPPDLDDGPLKSLWYLIEGFGLATSTSMAIGVGSERRLGPSVFDAQSVTVPGHLEILLCHDSRCRTP